MGGWTRRGANPGMTRLTESQFVELACRVLRNHHGGDVISRMTDYLGDRAARMGPVDLGQNVAISWCDRVCRAYAIPPFASGVTSELAKALGDVSASTTIARYARIGGRPLPTTVVAASAEAQRYQELVGYAGVLLRWSERTGRISLEVVTPDVLDLEYSSDDPTEPTVIRHRGTRRIGDRVVDVVEVYDLTDLAVPSYRVLAGDDDITADVHGRTYTGDGYLSEWSYADGRPYHRIIVRGHPRHTYAHLQQVEGSLVVPIRWTAWGSGADFANHPGRNVRNMRLKGQSSDTATGGTGFADGPDVIKEWADLDPDNPGDHWQDAPAFDPLTTARGIGLYQSMLLSMIDLPLQLDASGGEPTAREQEALAERVTWTYSECRRFDAELIRRCAALANRLPQVEGEDIPEGPYGLLYRDEITEALAELAKGEPEREDNGGREDRRGESGEEADGDAGEAQAGG